MHYCQTRLTGRYKKYFARSILDYFDGLVKQKKAVELGRGNDCYLLKDIYVDVSYRFKIVKGEIAVDSRGVIINLVSANTLESIVNQLRKEFPQLKKAQIVL